MNVIESCCKSLSCTFGCYGKKLAGAALVMTGILLLATFWLIPIGLLLAFVGMAMLDPEGQPCS